MFFLLKNIKWLVYIMWQRLKTFHQGKLEILRKNDKIISFQGAMEV